MLRNYLKLAWKVLLRRKFFTFISLFGISFTLLVLMVTTAVLDHVFAPHEVEPHADRTLYVSSVSMTGPNRSWGSGPGYRLLDRHVRTLPDVERVSVTTRPNRIPIYHQGEKMQCFFRYTDGEFWRIMNLSFVEGGPFTAEDDENGSRVAVINETTRERLFGGDSALGRSLDIEGRSFRIVGVVQDVPLIRMMTFSEIWAPIGTIKGDAYRRALMGDFTGIILARDRADFPAIKAEFLARLDRMELPDPDTFDKITSSADTIFESWARGIFNKDDEDADYSLWLRGIMLGTMLLFMLLPTLNLVNINLSRILERSSEIGVRKAFGASSRTLVGQFVMENVLLTLLGGALALVLSWITLAALGSSGVIPYGEFHLNVRIFFYGLLLAVFFGVFSGVYPAWRMSRLHPAEALRGRTT
jgi:putative ABC transport system permease protein